MIQSSSIDEIVFHRLGFATLGCESFFGGGSATELSSATASEITSPTAIAVFSPSAFLLNSSRHDDFFRWALNFLSCDASYMKKKKS